MLFNLNKFFASVGAKVIGRVDFKMALRSDEPCDGPSEEDMWRKQQNQIDDGDLTIDGVTYKRHDAIYPEVLAKFAAAMEAATAKIPPQVLADLAAARAEERDAREANDGPAEVRAAMKYNEVYCQAVRDGHLPEDPAVDAAAAARAAAASFSLSTRARRASN